GEDELEQTVGRRESTQRLTEQQSEVRHAFVVKY
ncbi:hypothetical protein HNQ59_003883, partial [Chitinivorax tropicus]|nr:hypothetical protein [Chitinivorax tropicus]